MVEASVRLLCPKCGKNWETGLTKLPAHHDNYSCQSYDVMRRTTEFMWTERDLQTLKQFE